MNENSKKSSGQPILSQKLDVIPGCLISRAARKYQSNRYYKKLPLRLHVVSLLNGVFSNCNGVREMFEGLVACEGKLVHLGFEKAPAGSTESDANIKRSYLVFEYIYYELLRLYHSFILDSRLKGLSILI
jgi:hypothetical protein